MDPQRFLHDLDLRRLTLPDAEAIEPVGLAIGPGSGGLEVAVAKASRKPSQATMRSVWQTRHGGRAAPLLLVVLRDDCAALPAPGGPN
jgi:hypothetical protein